VIDSPDSNINMDTGMGTDMDKNMDNFHYGGESRISKDIGKFLITDINDELEVEVMREGEERKSERNRFISAPVKLGMNRGNSRDDTSVSVVDAASSLANKLGALKNELGDLDDAHAQVMRQLLLSRGEVYMYICINVYMIMYV
jgi:hypothetical protein